MDETIKLREYAEGDSRDIVRIHNESQDCFEECELSEDFIKSIAYRADFEFLVAEQDKKVMGFCGFLFHQSVKRAEIGPICVDGAFRERGLGSVLLEKTEGRLKDMGIRRSIVKVKKKNKPALSFFQKNGFVQEGYFTRYTVDGDDVLQLRKFLG